MNQEKKAEIKKILDLKLKNVPIKYSLRVRNHSTIVCTISKGDIDFIGNYMADVNVPFGTQPGKAPEYIDVNPYHYRDQFSGEALEIVDIIIKALNNNNYDNSDAQTDYFDVGHYVDLNIGTWEKPYEYYSREKQAA